MKTPTEKTENCEAEGGTGGVVRPIIILAGYLAKVALLRESGTLKVSWKCGTEAEDDALGASFMALQKQLHGLDYLGNRKIASQKARECVLDILCNEKDWRAFGAIVAAFATANDHEFFECLGRGLVGKRNPLFTPDQWFLIMNWHGWLTVEKTWGFNRGKQLQELEGTSIKSRTVIGERSVPPLKWWTYEAIYSLLKWLPQNAENPDYKICVRSTANRLLLKQEKPAKITKFTTYLDDENRRTWVVQGPD